MRKILYIVNPVSGSRRKKDLQPVIEKKTSEAGFDFRIFPSVASGDYRFLHALICEERFTDIVIAGGDGTISQVVKGLMDLDLPFGIIPGGSGNGLAFTVSIPRDPAKALDIIFKGNALPTDGFYLNDQFACMLCGLGFDAKVAHDFAQQSRRGLRTYVRQVVRNFFSAKTYSFELDLKEQKIKTEAYFISIANSNQFGNNFTIAPRASLCDGLLDVVIVTRQNKFNLLLQTLRQLRGKNKLQAEGVVNDRKAVIYFQAEQLRIRNLSEAPLHIDGDPAETPRELAIKINKKCFRLFQPSIHRGA